MKKIFLVALAAIGMTACMQDEVVEIANGGAIAFDNAFVGNATRAEAVTTGNLGAFKVWGKVLGENGSYGVVFPGTEVTGNNGVWTYAETQYWMPNNAYSFAAIAPVSAVADAWDLNASRTIEFTTDGSIDLVYAVKEVAPAETYEKVAFQFEHLLSKVKLSFTQHLPENNVAYIENLVVKTVKTATVDLSNNVWTSGTETLSLNAALSNNATEDYFLVPAECVVSFDVIVKVGDVEVYNEPKTATIPADAFEMGHAYNLCADINPNTLALNEIEFSAEVTQWEEVPNHSDDAANLAYAAQIGGTYTLTNNVTVNAPVVVKEGVNFVLDLNGKTITAELKQEGRHHYAIDNYGTLTLKNGTINARGVENFGTMVIEEGVTITNVDTNGGSAIWNEGDLVINGGTFTTNAEAGEGSYGTALNTQKGGKAVINGGNFVANSQLSYAICNYGETVINNATVVGKHGAVAASEGAEIKTVINGGSFSLVENPNVSDHCVYYVSEIKGGTFTLGNNTDCGAQVFCESTIAAGYSVSENNGVYTVGLATVATTAALQAAINEGQSPIYLAANTTFGGTVVMKSNVTIEGLEGSKMHCVNLNGAQNVTLYNITFDAAGAAMSYGGDNAERYYANIFSRDNSNSAKVAGAKNLVIDGCHFTGTFPGEGGCVTSFADQTKTGSHNVTIKNCIFDIENCGYAIYGYYTGDNAGNFVIENNTFKTATYANTIYLGRYMSSKPVVLKDNTFEKVSTLNKAIYVQDHSNYGVSVDASGNTLAN